MVEFESRNRWRWRLFTRRPGGMGPAAPASLPSFSRCFACLVKTKNCPMEGLP